MRPWDESTWGIRSLARPDSGGTDLRLAASAPAEVRSRFCAWRGQSERRYVVTVYQTEAAAPSAGLPEFDECVVLAVGRGSLGRIVLDVSAVERGSDRRGVTARGLARGAVEWHVYFVGDSRVERAEIVADLQARHLQAYLGQDGAIARCA